MSVDIRLQYLWQGLRKVRCHIQRPEDEKSGSESDHSHPSKDQRDSDPIAAAIVAFTNEYKARDSQNQRQHRKNMFWVRVSAGLLAIYTTVTFFQLWTIQTLRSIIELGIKA
jgi:hypothetical protein